MKAVLPDTEFLYDPQFEVDIDKNAVYINVHAMIDGFDRYFDSTHIRTTYRRRLYSRDGKRYVKIDGEFRRIESIPCRNAYGDCRWIVK